MHLPEIAVSRDGQRAILVNAFAEGWHRVADRSATARDAVVRVAPRLPLVELRLIVTDTLPTFWNMPKQQYRWPESAEAAFPEIAVAAIGEYLDNVQQPPQPPADQYAAVVSITTDFFHLFERPPEQNDARLLRYIAGKVYWTYRLGADATYLGRQDGIRFGLEVDELHRVAWQSTGVLWQRDQSGGYKALPRLLTDFRAGVVPGQERSIVEQVEPLVDRVRYAAAALHIDKAIGFLHGANVDLENAAKEAVTAVESVAKVLLNAPGATLGDCIKELRARKLLPREMGRILDALYSYRNATPGVGHGSTTIPAVSPADATFILGVASVGITYLDSLWPAARSVEEAS